MTNRPITTRPSVRSRPIAIAATLALVAGAGPALLFRLAQFGQQPPERLPLAAALLFGVLLVGPLVDLLGAASAKARVALLAGFSLLATITVFTLTLTPYGEARHALSPAAAVIGAAVLGLPRFAPPGRQRLLAAAAVYVACTLLANFTLDSFIPVGDFLLLNVGTLFFGITFTQRDRIHPYGRRAVYGVIVTAAVANVLLSASLGTPLRYVAVSFLTILLAESADTEVYQRLIRRRWLTRVAASNAVSAPLDTLLFMLLAFWGEPFATPTWLTQVIVTDVLVKYAAGMAAALGMLALLRSLASLSTLKADRGEPPRDALTEA
ncbi:MAG: VUT family protein [Trueperaceae bacterium]